MKNVFLTFNRNGQLIEAFIDGQRFDGESLCKFNCFENPRDVVKCVCDKMLNEHPTWLQWRIVFQVSEYYREGGKYEVWIRKNTI